MELRNWYKLEYLSEAVDVERSSFTHCFLCYFVHVVVGLIFILWRDNDSIFSVIFIQEISLHYIVLKPFWSINMGEQNMNISMEEPEKRKQIISIQMQILYEIFVKLYANIKVLVKILINKWATPRWSTQLFWTINISKRKLTFE